MDIKDVFKSKINSILNIIKGTINEDILKYIDVSVKIFDDELERAVAIYILLGEIFTYDTKFYLFQDWRSADRYTDISMDNNSLMCYQWSMIMNKILKYYNINSYVEGTEFGHYYVKIIIDKTLYYADITKYGGDKGDYELSDLANVRFHFKIKYYEAKYNFKRSEELDEKKEELKDTIDIVYEKLGINALNQDIFEEYIQHLKDKVDERILISGNMHDSQDIEYRIYLLNGIVESFIGIEHFERMLLLHKYCYSLFGDFDYNAMHINRIYEVKKGEIVIHLLISVKDKYGLQYYFLEENSCFVMHNRDSLLFRMDEANYMISKNGDIIGIKKQELAKYLAKKSECLKLLEKKEL